MGTKKKLKKILKDLEYLISEVDKAPGGDYTIGVQCFFIACDLEKLGMELTPTSIRNLEARTNQSE